MIYAFSENFILPLSHDEVVHGKGSLLGKMPGDEWRRFAGLRALLAYMWAHPGKQLLFMGSEFGQVSEWSADNGLDWWVLDFDVHQGVQRLSRDLNATYRQTPALWQLDTSPEGFSWIDANDAQGNVLSFLRFAGAQGASRRAGRASPTSPPVPAPGLPGRAAAGGPLARGPQHRRGHLRRQRRRATWAASRPWPSPGTASPPRPRSPSRRWACLWLSPSGPSGPSE